jgi:hypothetical protein
VLTFNLCTQKGGCQHQEAPSKCPHHRLLSYCAVSAAGPAEHGSVNAISTGRAYMQRVRCSPSQYLLLPLSGDVWYAWLLGLSWTAAMPSARLPLGRMHAELQYPQQQRSLYHIVTRLRCVCREYTGKVSGSGSEQLVTTEWVAMPKRKRVPVGCITSAD